MAFAQIRRDRSKTALGLIASVLMLVPAFAPAVRGGAPPALSGGILGQVKSPAGVVQMGATVFLYNRYEQLVRQGLTNEEGKFVFDKLSPDLYSIRVTLASFVPAMRRNIAVAAGSENLLQINLATLLSSIDLVSSGPSRGALMSDEWKWVLRSSQSTRPVLRLLPVSSSASNSTSSVFSETTGLLKVSAGDGDSFASGGEQDLGTAFALATSIYGSTRVQFSGNIGYMGNSTVPTAGFRTSYSRRKDGQSSPQVIVTVRQLFLPGMQAPPNQAASEAGPVLRTMSLAVRDKLEITDQLHLEYGASLESVSFLQRLNYGSPFARLTYDLGNYGSVRIAYSDGSDPSALLDPMSSTASAEVAHNAALSQDLAALALLPRISLRDSQVRVQRTQNFEAGYRVVQGSRTYSAGMYHESVSNASFMLSGPPGFAPLTDTLPDLASDSHIFNAGNYDRVGYTAAAKQALGEHSDLTFAAGRAGGLADSTDRLAPSTTVSDAEVIRSGIREVQRLWATAAFATVIPVTGTRVLTSYGWTDPRTMMPDHVFMTQDVTQSTGWNVRVRQPLPVWLMGGRLEATAEMRNLLAQGYLPVQAGGRSALLTNSPKAIRGGLAFIF